MPGMYPDDQVVTIFGTEVRWPGTDPETGKFTNGDFSEHLKKPSFIPAQTVNLILDNLQNFISGLGLDPNNTGTNQLLQALQNKYIPKEETENLGYPLGSCYIQYPDGDTPLEAGLPGDWEDWTARPVMYGLSPTSPPAGFAADFAAHDASIWNLKGDGTVVILETKKYSWPLGYLYNSRRKCGNKLIDDDWEIGYQISTGPYAGMYVWEPYSLAGKFLFNRFV
jgi:hypothetical protein